jgi:hypothetical protein
MFAFLLGASMPKLVRSIVSVIARRFRSRAVLELENLALRHKLHVLRRQQAGSAPAVYDQPRALGLGSTGYGRAVWTRWCWSSRQRSSNGTVSASAFFGDGVREPDGRQWIVRFVI